uniref:Fucosyltransferase n=1 Tax=Rodentolepis nana TaxID=102285 RepID=A0A0R3TZY8_RODNA
LKHCHITKKHVSQMLSENVTHLLPSYHKNRTKLVAWVVSNGRPTNNPNQYANALELFVPAIVQSRSKIFFDLIDPYFHSRRRPLDLQNTGMEPIVLGAYKEDYESVLPPHSYINVDDLDSIQELAEYLQFLDKNDTAYAQYFAWTKHGPIIVNSDSPRMIICCMKLVAVIHFQLCLRL